MKPLAFHLLLAFHAVAFAARAEQCELRLTTNIALVTERALAQGTLQLEQLREMVNSGTPLNPLRFATPNSSTSNLKRFYEISLSGTDWQNVRGELRALLEQRTGAVRVQQLARVATERVFSPRFELEQPTRTLRDLKLMPNGELYLLLEPEVGHYEVKQFLKPEPIATFDGANARLEIGRDGTPFAVSYLPSEPTRWLGVFSRTRAERVAKNLTNGEVTRTELRGIPETPQARLDDATEAPETLPVNPDAYKAIRLVRNPGVAARRIGNAGFAVTAFYQEPYRKGESFFLYYPPSRGAHESPDEIATERQVFGVKIYETSDSRVILFVTCKESIEVFEPAVSKTRLFKAEMRGGFRVWEQGGKLYLAAADNVDNVVRFYEPLVSEAVIGEAPAPREMAAFAILPFADQTYLVEQYIPPGVRVWHMGGHSAAPLSIYSLFNATRSER